MAARAAFLITVLGPDGRPLEGASVTLRDVDNDNASIYPSRTGGSPGDNPMTTNAQGMVYGFADRGIYTEIRAHASMDTQTFDLDLTPGADSTVDAEWLAEQIITLAQIASTLLPSGGAGAADETLRALGTSAGQALPGNHASVTNARSPTAHASSHISGGSDKIYTYGVATCPAGGGVSVTHGLGATPSVILLTQAQDSGGGHGRYRVISKDGTTFAFNSADLTANTNVYWVAFL